MHAVGGRAVDIKRVGVVLRGPHRHIERERIARAAAVAVGRDDRHRTQGPDRDAERRQTLGAVTIVVGE